MTGWRRRQLGNTYAQWQQATEFKIRQHERIESTILKIRNIHKHMALTLWAKWAADLAVRTVAMTTAVDAREARDLVLQLNAFEVSTSLWHSSLIAPIGKCVA